MSGTIDHNQAVADVPAEPEGFFFSLQADEDGVSELKFRKDAEKLFRVLLFSLAYINETFDQPFATVGDFCRHIGEVSDQIEAAHNQQEQGNGQATDPSPDAPEAA